MAMDILVATLPGAPPSVTGRGACELSNDNLARTSRAKVGGQELCPLLPRPGLSPLLFGPQDHCCLLPAAPSCMALPILSTSAPCAGSPLGRISDTNCVGSVLGSSSCSVTAAPDAL